MKSIKSRFNKVKEKNPYLSTYRCFFTATKGQEFKKQAISRWFNKLVDKDDYSSDIKKSIISDILKTQKVSEDNQK